MLIRLVDHGIGVEMAFALGRLRSQDMALKRVTALELTRSCLLEALGGATMCLQLRHSRLSITTQTHVSGQCRARAKLNCPGRPGLADLLACSRRRCYAGARLLWRLPLLRRPRSRVLFC